MKKNFIFLFTGILNFSCAGFMEYPLEQESVSILAPINGFESKESSITFWWEKHLDAKFYRLQLVCPNFNDTEILLLDSLLSDNKLKVILDVGLYSWRVRPENHGSVGQFKEERSIRILNNEKQ